MSLNFNGKEGIEKRETNLFSFCKSLLKMMARFTYHFVSLTTI